MSARWSYHMLAIVQHIVLQFNTVCTVPIVTDEWEALTVPSGMSVLDSSGIINGSSWSAIFVTLDRDVFWIGLTTKYVWRKQGTIRKIKRWKAFTIVTTYIHTYTALGRTLSRVWFFRPELREKKRASACTVSNDEWPGFLCWRHTCTFALSIDDVLWNDAAAGHCEVWCHEV